MSEAVNAFCAFLFRRYPLEAITAEHFKDNPGSGRVLQKIGFCATIDAITSQRNGKIGGKA
ncbi:MAG TPA: hypothetical protein DCM70_04275 [Rhodobacteraceae bacterium]|jgi:RimJ/RimL family protein N-acetyltransferase|nr:hypothetical protein [Paracoccaceae bacterium]